MDRIKGVVLQAPFTCIMKFDSEMKEVSKIFKSDEKIHSIKASVTVIHGKKR